MKEVETAGKFHEGKDYRLKYETVINQVSPSKTEEKVIMKLVKRQSLDEGLFTLELDDIYKLPPEDHFRYGLKFVSNQEDNSNQQPKSKLVRRSNQEIQNELYVAFASALKDEVTLLDEKDDLILHWGLKFDGEFDPALGIKKEFSWRLTHCLSSYQRVSDYYSSYLRYVSRIEDRERNEAHWNRDTLEQRIMRLFVLDLMGYYNAETQILRRRTYRDATPRKPVYLVVKLVVIALFVVTNILFLYYFWETFRKLNHERQYIWFSTFFICLLVDMGIIENIFSLWNYYVIPSLCYPKVEEMLRIIQRASQEAGTGQETGQERPFEKAAKQREIMQQNKMASFRPQGKNNKRLLVPFDTADYFFVSKQFAKLFPETRESKIVLNYHSASPDKILVAPITDFSQAPLVNSASFKEVLKNQLLFFGRLPLLLQNITVSYLIILFFFVLWFSLTAEEFSLTVIWYIAAAVGSIFLFTALFSARSKILLAFFGRSNQNLKRTALVHPISHDHHPQGEFVLHQMESNEKHPYFEIDDTDDENTDKIEIIVSRDPAEHGEEEEKEGSPVKNDISFTLQSPDPKGTIPAKSSPSPKQNQISKSTPVNKAPSPKHKTASDFYAEVNSKREQVLKTLSIKNIMDLHQLSRSNSETSSIDGINNNNDDLDLSMEM
jgi:hypothetical protein